VLTGNATLRDAAGNNAIRAHAAVSDNADYRVDTSASLSE
jgi:hypothetical protein